jgi:hypothetical protein
MELIEQIKGEFAAFAEKKKALTDQLKGEFPAILKPLFDKYPSVDTIRWHQYTPYFNDGDECTFSAHIDSLAINDDEMYETSDGNEEAAEDFSTALGEISEEMLKDIFGDHVEVTVNRDGTVKTDEYEHD